MCYSVEYLERRAQKYAERYKDVIHPGWGIDNVQHELPLFYFVSGFSHPQLPIVKADGIFLFEWGLIPSWVKDEATALDIRSKTLNAVGETVFDKPSYRKSIISRRCLLGVNGFFEWREFNKVKYPYLITLKKETIFSLGCIYDTWVDQSTGEIKNTFSILTTAANPLMEKIHNTKKRMPLIIKSEDEAAWVDPVLPVEQIKALITPFAAEDMQAITVSKLVSNVRAERNVPEVIESYDYSELPD